MPYYPPASSSAASLLSAKPVGWWTPSAEATADATAVSIAPDLSGNNVVLTGTGTAKPLIKTNIQNGLRAYLFDGTNDVIDAGTAALSAFTKSARQTFICVFRPTGTISTTQLIMANDNSAGATPFGMAIVGSKLRCTYGVTSSADSATLVSGTTYTGTIRYDGANIISQVNGANRATTAQTGDTGYSTLYYALGDLPFSHGASPQAPFTGYIMEGVQFACALSDADILTEEARLRAKWAHY